MIRSVLVSQDISYVRSLMRTTSAQTLPDLLPHWPSLSIPSFLHWFWSHFPHMIPSDRFHNESKMCITLSLSILGLPGNFSIITFHMSSQLRIDIPCFHVMLRRVAIMSNTLSPSTSVPWYESSSSLSLVFYGLLDVAVAVLLILLSAINCKFVL